MRWLLPLWAFSALLFATRVANAAETSLPICVPDPTTERDAIAFLDNWVATARVVVAREPCPVAGPGRYVGRFETRGRDVIFVLSTPSSGRLEKHIPWLQGVATPLSDLLSAGRLSEFSVWIEALLAEDRLVSGWGGQGSAPVASSNNPVRGPHTATEVQRSSPRGADPTQAQASRPAATQAQASRPAGTQAQASRPTGTQAQAGPPPDAAVPSGGSQVPDAREDHRLSDGIAQGQDVPLAGSDPGPSESPPRGQASASSVAGVPADGLPGETLGHTGERGAEPTEGARVSGKDPSHAGPVGVEDPLVEGTAARVPQSSHSTAPGSQAEGPGPTGPDDAETDAIDIRSGEMPEESLSLRLAAGAGYRFRSPDIVQPEASLTVGLHGFQVRGAVQSPTTWNLGGLPLEVRSVSLEGGWGFLLLHTNEWSLGGDLGVSVDRLELRPLYRTSAPPRPTWDVGPYLGSHLGWRPWGAAFALRLSGAVLWMPAAPLTRVGEIGPRTRVNALGARLGLELSFPG